MWMHENQGGDKGWKGLDVDKGCMRYQADQMILALCELLKIQWLYTVQTYF